MASIPLKIQRNPSMTIDLIAKADRLLRFRDPRALERFKQRRRRANREDLVKYIKILQDRDSIIEQSG